MATRSPGFTLLEVMVALLVITLGLVGLAGSLGPITALAGKGRMQGRIALVLESRADRMRMELLGSAPSCIPPAGGSLRHEDGVFESWSAGPTGGLIELRVVASTSGKNPESDTLVTRASCP